MPEIRAATLEELHNVRQALEDIKRVLPGQVEDKVKEVAVPRDEYARRVKASGRRVVAGMVALVVLVVLLVGWNRLTLKQSQDDFRRLVITCRTTGPALSAADMAYCEDRIPGFGQASQRIRATAAKAERSEQRLAHLEAEVAALKE